MGTNIQESTCLWKKMWGNINSLRQDWKLCDATLVTEDETMIMAHSVVLAATSPLFRLHFIEKVQTSIVNLENQVMIPGIKGDELEATIDFLYGNIPSSKESAAKVTIGARILGIDLTLMKMYLEGDAAVKESCEHSLVETDTREGNIRIQNMNEFCIGVKQEPNNPERPNGIKCEESWDDHDSEEVHEHISDDSKDSLSKHDVKHFSGLNVKKETTVPSKKRGRKRSAPVKITQESHEDLVEEMPAKKTRVQKSSKNKRSLKMKIKLRAGDKKAVRKKHPKNKSSQKSVSLKSTEAEISKEENDYALQTNEENIEVMNKLKSTKAEKVFCCLAEGCNYSNRDMGIVQSHMFRYHNIGQPDYHCPLCQGKYFRARYLDVHMKRSHFHHYKQNNKDILCTDCGSMFTNAMALQIHQLKVHQKGSLFSCEDCDFKTPRKREIQAHRLCRHGKATPGLKFYSCTFCDYKCLDKKRYDEHEARHTGAKKFLCPDCGKAYTTRRGMQTHIVYMHTDGKKHECELCGAKFKTRNKLTDHRNIVHVQPTTSFPKPFKCGYCAHVSASRGNCKKHVVRSHPNLPCVVIDLLGNNRKAHKDYDYATLQGPNIEVNQKIEPRPYANIGNADIKSVPPKFDETLGTIEVSITNASSFNANEPGGDSLQYQSSQENERHLNLPTQQINVIGNEVFTGLDLSTQASSNSDMNINQNVNNMSQNDSLQISQNMFSSLP